MRLYPVLLSFISVLSLSTCLPAQQGREFRTLQQGTPVPVRLEETINSTHARLGERVALEVPVDVVLDGQIMIPAGSSALGTVAMVQRHGWTGHSWHEHAGRVEVNVDAVRLPGGQVVPLSMTQDAEIHSVTNIVSPKSDSRNLGARQTDERLAEGTVLHAYVRRDTIIVQQTASVSN